MKYINLAYPEKSPVEIKVDIYPDTQVSVTVSEVIVGEDYVIKARASTYQDLFKIAATNSVLRGKGANRIRLFVPWVIGSRSDSSFTENQSLDVKLVTDFINACGFDEVVVLDPHSGVLPALLNNRRVIPAFDWINSVMLDGFNFSDKVLISPDAGSYKKVSLIAEELNIPLITGSKVRINGEPKVLFHGDVSGQDCVIIDDIWDGGRTFELLGGQLKGLGARSVTLFVTHGMFHKGMQWNHIDQIYTTNSYKHFTDTPDNLFVHDVFN